MTSEDAPTVTNPSRNTISFMYPPIDVKHAHPLNSSVHLLTSATATTASYARAISCTSSSGSRYSGSANTPDLYLLDENNGGGGRAEWGEEGRGGVGRDMGYTATHQQQASIVENAPWFSTPYRGVIVSPVQEGGLIK